MNNLKKLVSALPLLNPTAIFNVETGEEVALIELKEKIRSLLDYCCAETNQVYSSQETHILSILFGRSKIIAPAEFARQNNIKIRKNLPANVKAQSRIEKLVQYKIISEASSYLNNSNPRKQAFTFNKTINLGAVDKQMASLSLDGTELTLLWKCWDKEYLLTFTIPEYVLKRNILKFTLPVISEQGFRFTVMEQVPEKPQGKHKAGLDLGRKIPYTIAVTNQAGNRVAHYITSKNLTKTNNKREHLLVQKKQLNQKILVYNTLGLSPEKLIVERDYVRNKITRMSASLATQLGAEIKTKLVKHNLNIIQMEDLRWVTGSKYGGRWNHSRQQHHITHSLARTGIKTKIVNPKNTSQECYNCGTKLVHNTKTRTVWCIECKTVLDRDFNAAMNIANRIKTYPVSKRENGGNCSLIPGQVIELVVHKRLIKQEKQLN